MSVEENKALVRRFYEEVWDKGNTGFAYEVFADDYVRHDLRPTRAVPGPEGQKRVADDFRAALPDLRVTVDLVVGEDDYASAAGQPPARISVCGAPWNRRVATPPFLPSTSTGSRTARLPRSGTTETTLA
jgi:hypothetical protein